MGVDLLKSTLGGMAFGIKSGKKYKRAAQQAAAYAEELQEEQQEIDFGRAMLSNIRQQRIAQAQLTTTNYSPSFTSTGAIGAASNINSALASDMGYAYSTSMRQQRIADYQADAQKYMGRYAKQDAKNKMYIQLISTAGAAAIGGGMAGGSPGGLTAAQGAMVGAQLGGAVGSAINGNISGAIQQGIGAATSYMGFADTNGKAFNKELVNRYTDSFDNSQLFVKSREQLEYEQLTKYSGLFQH